MWFSKISVKNVYELRKDGKLILRGSETECWHKLHQIQSGSVDHAIKHEGYTINPINEDWKDHYNWYPPEKSKDMPLPSEAPIKPYDEEYVKGILWGAEEVNRKMTKEIAEKEQELYPEMKYIGQGQIGVVYEVGPDKVVKYTTDESEYNVAFELLENPIDCTAKVFDVEYLGFVYRIVLEKVKPLSIEEIKEFNYPDSAQREFLEDCLELNGWRHQDLHGANVGYNSDDNLVILDIGGMDW